MKKITNLLFGAVLMLLSNGIKAQCASSFTWSAMPNGVFTFTSTSIGTSSLTQYFWSFGDGNNFNAAGVNGMATMHTYSANGTYSVTLFIMNVPTCSASVTHTINVSNATGCNLNANFSWVQNTNGNVNFSNFSTGTGSGTTYLWNFGDNTAFGTTASPPHTYSANGSYVVKLFVNNNTNPACADSIQKTIVINSYCTLVPSFTWSQGANGLVNFGSTSTGTTPSSYYIWQFGDGGQASGTNPFPSHVYQNGTYGVTLTVNSNSVNAMCIDTVSQQITVTSYTCIPNANFSLTPTGTPNHWNAIPALPSSSIASATWYWGDGSSSNTYITSHQYSASATYSICLSVTLTCGTSTTYCLAQLINKSADGSGNAVYQVNVVDPGSTTGLATNGAISSAYNVYPNPANGEFNVQASGLKSDRASIEIFNLVGQVVYSAEVEVANGSINKQISLDNEKQGVYILKINAGDSSHSQKVILRH